MGRLADQFAAAQARGMAVMDMTVTRDGVSSTVAGVWRDVDDCGFPKPAVPAKPKARSTMPRGVYDLACVDCGRGFRHEVRSGNAPKRCPECTRAHEYALRNERDRAKRAERAAQPREVACADCGRVFEAHAHGRLPKRCPECRAAREEDLRIKNRLRKEALARCR